MPGIVEPLHCTPEDTITLYANDSGIRKKKNPQKLAGGRVQVSKHCKFVRGFHT